MHSSECTSWSSAQIELTENHKQHWLLQFVHISRIMPHPLALKDTLCCFFRSKSEAWNFWDQKDIQLEIGAFDFLLFAIDCFVKSSRILKSLEVFLPCSLYLAVSIRLVTTSCFNLVFCSMWMKASRYFCCFNSIQQLTVCLCCVQESCSSLWRCALMLPLEMCRRKPWNSTTAPTLKW